MVYIPDVISVDTDLQLRVPMESDASALFNLVEENRTYLREWLPWLDETTSVQDEVNFIQDQTAKHQTADGSLFIIESLDVGTVSYTHLTLPTTPYV